MTFADKLITLRKKAGWSQEELAARLDVTRQSVSKWEGAQSLPDIDKIVQMSRLFGVTTDYLLKDEQSEPAVETAPTAFPLPCVTEKQDDCKAVRDRLNALAKAYWLVVVAIFLWYTYGPDGNAQPQYSWFIWAIAGVIFAAGYVVAKAVMKKGK